MDKNEDEKYMRRCLQLARNGRQGAAPNPMVGAVIVCDGTIIGEGYHRRCGEAHAEVNAIRSVRRPELLPRATIYVSLEPCSHDGRTPPCADLLIEKRLRRVVVGCIDPFAKVAGRGIQKLRDAGIEVTVGVLEEACRTLNRRFMTFHREQRPYIVLKWAQSADGYIDVCRDGGEPVMLSSPLTQVLVHKRRAECQAILVGRRTAVLDNPSLTVRHWAGSNPLRVVLAPHGNLPEGLKLWDGRVPTLVFTTVAQLSLPRWVEVVRLNPDKPQIPQLLSELHARDVQSLMVEGGRELLQGFIDGGWWDEAVVERASVCLQAGVPAPLMDTNVPFCVEKCMDTEYLHFFRKLSWMSMK